MKVKYKAILITLLSLAAIAITVIYMSNHNIPVLNPKGIISYKERNLILISCGLMLIVVIPVFIMTLFFSWKYRDGNKGAPYKPDWGHSAIAETVWWGVPFVIIMILAVITWKSTHELNPFKPLDSNKKPITIQAVALEWKWLFIYPEHNIATINYIQFPKDTPLNFEITADAPMNSFWIPQLGGQIYAMAAMRSKLHLIANEEGTYRGCSANFSGAGFAAMNFSAVASSEDDFNSWVRQARQGAQNLSFETYQQLISPSKFSSPQFYHLQESDLFEQILMKYNPPSH